MAVGNVSLSKVINEDYIVTLQKMSKVSSANSSSSDDEATSYASALQSGARVYANSISGLNAIISYLNVSQTTLSSLLSITDGMMELADDAKSTTLGTQSRNRLNIRYNKLRESFRELVAKADEADRNFLSKEGIENLLSIVGLDPESSKSIAAVFEEFWFDGEDNLLASEDIKPLNTVKIPKSAYGRTVTTETSKYETIEVQTENQAGMGGETECELGKIATSSNVVQQVVDDNSVVSFINKKTGQINTLGNDGYQYKLKDVNEESGFSVVSKYVDDENESDLYLVDNVGTVVQKLTSTQGNYGEVKISDDSKTIICANRDIENETETLQKITIGTLWDESSVTVEDIATHTEAFENVFTDLQISSDASHIAYRDTIENKIFFQDLDTLQNDDFFSDEMMVEKFGFIDNNTLAVFNGSEIQKYEYGSENFETIVEEDSIDKFEILEKKSAEHGYIAYTKLGVDGVNDLVLINDEGREIKRYQYDENVGDDIASISLAYNSADVAELGIVGKLHEFGEAENNKLYRLTGEEPARYTRVSKVATSAFDSTISLRSPADAYRAENALQTLKEQLEKNLEVMTDLCDTVSLNIDLVRATGFALLDLSEEVTTFDDADTLARKLKIDIRKNAPQALSQAENLEPIAVATMMLNDELES